MRSSVTTVIPAFNAGRFLAVALESVLSQSYPADEIIVVDDGSTDDTREVASRFGSRVRVEERPHAGQAAALNHGVASSRGDLLAFLDADDLWEPEKLEKQMARFDAEPELDAVFAHMRNFFSSELDDEARRRLKTMRELQPGYCPGTMLIRTAAFQRVGTFDERWQFGAFISWYARVADAGLRSALLNDVLLLRRIHGDNFSRRAAEHRQDYVRIAAEMVARRRKLPSPDGEGSS